MDAKKLGNRIAYYRKEKNLSQQALAILLHVDRRTISKWECGIYTPDVLIIGQLARALGITISDLLDENNKIFETSKKI